jgi:hypothetical protein
MEIHLIHIKYALWNFCIQLLEVNTVTTVTIVTVFTPEDQQIIVNLFHQYLSDHPTRVWLVLKYQIHNMATCLFTLPHINTRFVTIIQCSLLKECIIVTRRMYLHANRLVLPPINRRSLINRWFPINRRFVTIIQYSLLKECILS